MNTNKNIVIHEKKIGNTICLVGDVGGLMPRIMAKYKHDLQAHKDQQNKLRVDSIVQQHLFDMSPDQLLDLRDTLAKCTISVEWLPTEPIRPLVPMTRPSVPLGGFKFGEMHVLSGGATPVSKVMSLNSRESIDAMKAAWPGGDAPYKSNPCKDVTTTPSFKENNVTPLFGRKETST